jgi:hypothetical protein
MTRIIRHELLLLLNGARGSLTGWSNLLTPFVALPMLILVTHSWFAEVPADRADMVMALLGFVTGIFATHLLAERAQYHQTLGILAEEALALHTSLQSFASLLAMVIAGAAGLAGLIYPDGLGLFLVAAAAGVATRSLLLVLAIGVSSGNHYSAISRTLLPFAGNWRNGVLLGLAVGLLAAISRALLAPETALSLAVLLPCIPALVLAILDADTIRFLAQSGFTPGQIIWKHARALLAFGCAALPSYALGTDIGTAAILGGIVMVMLLVQAARVLCYRLYPKRLADFAVTVLLIATVLAAIAVPFLAPIVFAAPVLRLWRMASSATWQIA